MIFALDLFRPLVIILVHIYASGNLRDRAAKTFQVFCVF